MFKSLKNKLYRIQEGDERTKKHWIIMMTIFAMIAVTAVWIIYLNFTKSLIPITAPTATSSEFASFDWKNKFQQFQNIFNEAKSNIEKINQTNTSSIISSSSVIPAQSSVIPAQAGIQR